MSVVVFENDTVTNFTICSERKRQKIKIGNYITLCIIIRTSFQWSVYASGTGTLLVRRSHHVRVICHIRADF